MIPELVPHQANPADYTYASGIFSVRRGRFLPASDLRRLRERPDVRAVAALMEHGLYGQIETSAGAHELLQRVEETWGSFLVEAAGLLPEPFLPQLLGIVEEKEYAKAGLAAWLLYGPKMHNHLRGTALAYAELCGRLRADEAGAAPMRESVFSVPLSEGLDAAHGGASFSGAQEVFDAAVVDMLHRLATAYGSEAVQGYVTELGRLMVVGLALKAKLRSELTGVSLHEDVGKILPPQLIEQLDAVTQRIAGIPWSKLQPAQLMPELRAGDLPAVPHTDPGTRIALLSDALDAALSEQMSGIVAEPYGTAVVFRYMMDFRYEVSTLRCLLKFLEVRPAEEREAKHGS